MHPLAVYLLKNKPEFIDFFYEMDKSYNYRFSKKLRKEKNAINVLSLFTEIEFGYLLTKYFTEVKFEPNIENKTPDWLVISKEQKIMFEVVKINPSQNVLQNKIDLALSGKLISQTSGTAFFSFDSFHKQMVKISQKEKKYRHLIQSGYKLVICFEVMNLTNQFITKNDIKLLFSFSNKSSIVSHYDNIIKNVSGIIAKPMFGGKIFIENKETLYPLDAKDLFQLKKINC